MINELIDKLNLPPLLDRNEMLSILCEQEYGCLPKHDSVSFEKMHVSRMYNKFFGGKVKYEKILVTARFGQKTFSFPIEVTVPAKEGKHPFFVFIALGSLSGLYYPYEEIIDNGFGIAKILYTDVTSDNDDFTNGLAGVLYENGIRNCNDCGKIAMWAWAASRTLDYLESTDYCDIKKVTVCGHSRLGKTALLAAATDERFYCAHSNNSGCSGASLARNNKGETVSDIITTFPYWFCENYKKYAKKESDMPFDQHYLLACVAPRKVYVSSASEDEWADPKNEYLSCVAAGSAFENGFVHPDRLARVGDSFHSGDIGYHIREGSHFHTRQDWNEVIKFLKSKF